MNVDVKLFSLPTNLKIAKSGATLRVFRANAAFSDMAVILTAAFMKVAIAGLTFAINITGLAQSSVDDDRSRRPLRRCGRYRHQFGRLCSIANHFLLAKVNPTAPALRIVPGLCAILKFLE